MQKFEVLPHTADTRLRIISDDINGIFVSALEGMSNIIKNDCFLYETDLNLTENVNVDSLDESMLLVDFLSVILTLSHKNKAVYKIKRINGLSNTAVNAVLEGIKLNGFDEDIKAVTYTEAKIIKNSTGMYEAIIVFDI